MRKSNGSVSVFMAMIFLLVISVITTTILSARVHGAKSIVSTSVSLSVDSVFAQYDSELFEQFGVLFFDGTNEDNELDKDAIAEKIYEYLSENIDNKFGTDLYGITIKGISIDDVETATDYGGLLWMDEVVDFEKYAKVINLAADFLGIGDSEDKIDAINDIVEQSENLSDTVVRVNDEVNRLITYIDGVTYKNGVLVGDVQDYFLKKYKINNSVKFDPRAMNASNKTVNPIEQLKVVKNYIAKNNTFEAERNLDDIRESVKQMLELIDTFENDVLMINSGCNELEDGVEGLENSIEDASEIIGDDMAIELAGSFKDCKDYKEVLKENVCDITLLTKTVEYDKGLLYDISTKLETAKTSDDIDDIIELFSKYSYDGFDIDYSFFEGNDSHSNIFKSLKKIFQDGFLYLLVPDGKTVSTKKLTIDKSRAGLNCSFNTDYYMTSCSTSTRAAKKVVYGEYVMDNFNSFIDGEETNTLDYEVEYILNGNPGDAENLFDTIKKIAVLRSGVNMLYLLTDSEKKEDAYGLSETVFGWTKLEPLIKAMQYVFLYLWAYAEGLLEAKTLLSGRKVPLVKTKENWQMEFSDLLALNFTVDEEKTDKGLNYETYLRTLLYFEDEGEKSATTMNLVEAWKIKSGDSDFRLKNYVYSIKGEVIYTISGSDRTYTYKFAETY